MKVSTKGRYGLRALVDLALFGSSTPLALYQIAERQGISENYLEQMFSILRKSGFVKSVKGAQGGYSLAFPADKIIVGDVLRALEGDLLIVDVDGTEGSPTEDSIQFCIQKNVWNKVNEAVLKVLDSITLMDLAEDYRTRAGKDAIMFFI